LEGTDNGQFPPSQFLILIPTFLFILMFVFLQKPLKFWVEKVLEKWMSKVSSIHVCQCAFAILWQGFYVTNGKVFVCHILENVANIKNDLLFFTCVNITHSFSKVSAGLPGLCSGSAMMYLKVPP
jgi:hypothetical protein